jgi:hypothetical protein
LTSDYFFEKQFIVIPSGVRVRIMLPHGIFAKILNFSVDLFSHYSQKEKTRRRTPEVIGRTHHMAFNP